MVASPTDNQPAETTANTFLRFLNQYPNTFFRFSTASRRTSVIVDASSGPDSTTKHKTLDNTKESSVHVAASKVHRPFLGPGTVASSMYPLSTIVIVALIAFLIGSLLRSLLSPADFIYVVTDRKEIDDGGTGWREIKRLLEVKYIVGGWDFQIAVVRRH